MNAAIRRLVRERAADCCEYCGLRQEHSPLAPLQIEHVRPVKHGGTDAEENLAMACIDCNLSKGSNVAGYDPETEILTLLFNPRRDDWHEHFEAIGPFLVGKTAIGRTTIAVLNINSDDQIELRRSLA